ncbi:MAG TPA: FadR/GntR family transcriptional regulator, partial [Bacillota bacterium]|nr:FadR/GntR family transcriptional regulator [Bacillota bacterium]
FFLENYNSSGMMVRPQKGKNMEKIVRQKLYEQVAKRLQEAIVKGRYKVGEKLPSERNLAERFGVNRLAVREALRTLETRGMVKTYPGEGTFVTNSTVTPVLPETLIRLFTEDHLEIKAVDELLLIRRYLEIAIIKNINLKNIDELVRQLDYILDFYSSAVQAGDREKVAVYDEQYHLALARAGEGKVLSSIAEVVWEIIRKYQRLYFLQCAFPEKILEYLIKIKNQLSQKKIDAAAQTMEKLLIYGDLEFRTFLLKKK